MQIRHTSRHEMHATEAVKQHIEDKLERCLGAFPRIESVHVILDHEARLHVAEIVVQAANHIRISATDKSENLYDAIDRSSEHAERQMRKERDKLTDHRR